MCDREAGPTVRPPRALGALLLVALSLLGCGPDEDPGRVASVAAVEALLDAGDHSPALARTMKAIKDHGDGPDLQLLAARACNGLARRGDAIAHATAGLGLLGEDRPELRAELQWAKGVGLVGRYRELGAEADWRAANTSLEHATAAGGRRFDAAVMLALIQDLGDHSNDARQLKFARLARELRPDHEDVAKLVTLLQTKGLEP